MNAQNIWGGTDYAWLPNSSRSQRFTLQCERVRVHRMTKEKVAGNQNATTFVLVQFVDKDTGEVFDKYRADSYGIEGKPVEGGKQFYKIRAYDIVDYWENVEDEYRHKVAIHHKREQEREQRELERLQRQRELDAQREHERFLAKQRLELVKQYLIDSGVDPGWIKKVTLDSRYYGEGIQLSFDAVERSMLAAGEKRKEAEPVSYGSDLIQS